MTASKILSAEEADQAEREGMSGVLFESHEALRAEVERLKKGSDAWEMAAVEWEGDYNGLLAERDNLKHENAELKRMRAIDDQQLSERLEDIAQLTKERDEAGRQRDELAIEIGRQAQRVVEATAELAKLEKEVLRLSGKVVDAKADAIREWADERVELIAAKYRLEAELAQTKRNVDIIHDRREDVAAKLDLIRRLTDNQAASAAAEEVLAAFHEIVEELAQAKRDLAAACYSCGSDDPEEQAKCPYTRLSQRCAELEKHLWQIDNCAADHVARFRNLADARGDADPGLMWVVNGEQQRLDAVRAALTSANAKPQEEDADPLSTCQKCGGFIGHGHEEHCPGTSAKPQEAKCETCDNKREVHCGADSCMRELCFPCPDCANADKAQSFKLGEASQGKPYDDSRPTDTPPGQRFMGNVSEASPIQSIPPSSGRDRSGAVDDGTAPLGPTSGQIGSTAGENPAGGVEIDLMASLKKAYQIADLMLAARDQEGAEEK